MRREISSHKVNGCNEALTITLLDEQGHGGACHHYLISGSKGTFLPDAEIPPPIPADGYVRCDIQFQNGPIKEVGTNGVTHEALLAIVIDRLQSFQAGPYACNENEKALTKLEEAVHWLHHRTNARVARGVEGTHKK